MTPRRLDDLPRWKLVALTLLSLASVFVENLRVRIAERRQPDVLGDGLLDQVRGMGTRVMGERE